MPLHLGIITFSSETGWSLKLLYAATCKVRKKLSSGSLFLLKKVMMGRAPLQAQVPCFVAYDVAFHTLALCDYRAAYRYKEDRQT